MTAARYASEARSTRFRPEAFARYNASSARANRASGVSPAVVAGETRLDKPRSRYPVSANPPAITVATAMVVRLGFTPRLVGKMLLSAR